MMDEFPFRLMVWLSVLGLFVLLGVFGFGIYHMFCALWEYLT